MAAVLSAVPAEPSSPKLDRLASLEEVIGRASRTFVDVGLALAEVRDRALFRVEHESFRAYLEDRWGFGQAWAYQQIYTAQIAKAIMAKHGELPAGISAEALRPLVPLLNAKDAKAVARAWDDVLARYGRRQRPPSRSEVRGVLVDAGHVTCAPERPKAPEIGQIGISLERANDRVLRIRRRLDGRPLPPHARERAAQYAVQARALAAELEALADARAARAQLAAREEGTVRGGRAVPGEVFCESHGRVRGTDGCCLNCGVADLASTVLSG